jgi:flavin-binding protein dodecin
MAKKKKSDSVYRVVDVVGVSDKSWEDAGRRAVETAAGSLRDLRVAEVTKMDMRVKDGKVTAFRTRVALSFQVRGLIQVETSARRFRLVHGRADLISRLEKRKKPPANSVVGLISAHQEDC